MIEKGPQHPLTYRQEILSKLFHCIKSAESCYLLGGGSMGKTRLIDFLMRPEVQQAYLGDESKQTLLIRLDMNRLSEISEWGLYELALTTLVQVCALHPQPELSKLGEKLMKEFVIPLLNTPNTLKALRFLELSISNIMALGDYNICFLLDEFDETYQKLPVKAFAHLRAIRDLNKNQLSYALFVRNLPDQLRPILDNESFFELFSRTMIGIGPYTLTDALVTLKQLEERHNHPLQSDVTREIIYRLGGGHPGLMVGLFSLFVSGTLTESAPQLSDLKWLLAQEQISEECRKLQESLMSSEQNLLSAFVRGNFEIAPSMSKILLAKGLLRKENDKTRLFSPLFELYLK